MYQEVCFEFLSPALVPFEKTRDFTKNVELRFDESTSTWMMTSTNGHVLVRSKSVLPDFNGDKTKRYAFDKKTLLAAYKAGKKTSQVVASMEGDTLKLQIDNQTFMVPHSPEIDFPDFDRLIDSVLDPDPEDPCGKTDKICFNMTYAKMFSQICVDAWKEMGIKPDNYPNLEWNIGDGLQPMFTTLQCRIDILFIWMPCRI
jgi:hypothetical protein